MTYRRPFAVFAALIVIAVAVLSAQTPPQQPQQVQSQKEVTLIVSGPPGLPPKLAVPDFIPLTNDPQTVAAAKTVGRVLWDDLNFEREFYLIGRDTYSTIPPARSMEDVPLDRWKELGADGLVIGTVRNTGNGVVVQYRLIEVNSGRSAIAKEYSGSANSIRGENSRAFAHTIADEIHKQQRGLDGVARTKLAFTSDRDNERMKGPVGDRGVSNLYIADYDGARQTRVTVTRSLDITPVWSPDVQSIAFTSYRTGYQDIYVIFPFNVGRTMQNPTRGTAQSQNFLPVWSPDGNRLAFTSTRDGNPEIYVINKDGSGARRITNHPSIDVTPTWSPTGQQIAFVSDRTGAPQIYTVNADGTGLDRITSDQRCDRPTWSPAPYNEIAYASQVGGGFVIKVFDFASRSSRQITEAIGTNESPAFAPNGRHIAFVSTRAGKEQIFTIARDGRDLRQITRNGSNRYPNWSK
jgi:TolB protein